LIAELARAHQNSQDCQIRKQNHVRERFYGTFSLQQILGFVGLSDGMTLYALQTDVNLSKMQITVPSNNPQN